MKIILLALLVAFATARVGELLDFSTTCCTKSGGPHSLTCSVVSSSLTTK